MKNHFLTLATALFSAVLVLLTASASQAQLSWAPDAASPNGEFTDGLHGIMGGPTATSFGSAISYGVLTLDDGVTQVDYAVKLNSLSNLRHPADGAVAPSQLANNMFAVHGDGSADLYTAIQRNEAGAHVDISVCTFDLGTYDPVANMGAPTTVQFGVTAQNENPDVVQGSDGEFGSGIIRLNNNEQLFSTSQIVLVDSIGNQVETNGTINNLGTTFNVPTGFAGGTAFAWEAAGGTAYGMDGQLDVSEADFNVTYAPTSELRLRRDSDNGLNSAFGFAAAATAVPEPSSAAVLALGGLGLLVRRKKR